MLAIDDQRAENTRARTRILVIEDETKVGQALKEGIEGERYEDQTAVNTGAKENEQ
jgi:DNA-binding response OmpR family regulator